MPTTTTVREKVIATLRRLKPSFKNAQITDSTRPINDLGLKSIDGVDLAIEFEDEFGITIDDRINPLVNDQEKCARTVKEIVALVEDLVSSYERLFS